MTTRTRKARVTLANTTAIGTAVVPATTGELFVVTKDLVALAKAETTGAEKAGKALSALMDGFVSIGVTSAYMGKPSADGSNAHKAAYTAVERVAVNAVRCMGKTLSPGHVEMIIGRRNGTLALDPATMINGVRLAGTPAKDQPQMTWSGQVTSLIGRWARAMKARESAGNPKKTSTPKALEVYLDDTLSEMIAKIKKASNANIDLASFEHLLKNVQSKLRKENRAANAQ